MKSENNSPHPHDFKHTYAASGSTFPHGCHIAEIEVDAVTMRAKLTRFTVVDDFGMVINPLTLEGQIHGGVAQGVGQALMSSWPMMKMASCSPIADGLYTATGR